MTWWWRLSDELRCCVAIDLWLAFGGFISWGALIGSSSPVARSSSSNHILLSLGFWFVSVTDHSPHTSLLPLFNTRILPMFFQKRKPRCYRNEPTSISMLSSCTKASSHPMGQFTAWGRWSSKLWRLTSRPTWPTASSAHPSHSLVLPFFSSDSQTAASACVSIIDF